MTKKQNDIEIERLFNYYRDGYKDGIMRLKEIANDNPDWFGLDGLNNINIIIDNMKMPSMDHKDDDLDNKEDYKENNVKTANKDKIIDCENKKDITLLKEEKEIINDLHDIENHLKTSTWKKLIKITDGYLLEKAKKLIERLYNLKTKDEDTLITKIKNDEIDTNEVEKLEIIYDTDEFAEVFESPLQSKMSDVMAYFQAVNFLSKMILNFDKGLLISNGEITKESTYELLDRSLLSWGLSLFELNYEFMKFANLINTGKAEFKITLD